MAVNSLGGGRGRSSVGVEEGIARATPVVEPDGLWSIAMLRIAMELKRPGAPALTSIIDSVVGKMGIDRAQFEKYLSDNFGPLEDLAGAVRR